MRLSRSACLAGLAAFALATAASADRSAPGRNKKDAASAPAPAAPAPAAPAAPATPAAPAAPAANDPHAGHDHGPGDHSGHAHAAPAAPAAPAVTSGTGGKAEIVDVTYDAGTVARGVELVHAFQIKNTGDHPLTIDAKAGCGCTITEFDKIIAPGTTGKVNARVDTKTFKGPTSKTITLTTNDPERTRIVLTMKANVQVPIDVRPGENLAINGRAGALNPQQVTLTATGGEIFDILTISGSDNYFTTNVEPIVEEGDAPKAKPGMLASGASKYRVTVTPAQGIPAGRLNSTLTVVTNHPKAPETIIRLFGTVAGEIDVVPQYVSLATFEGASEDLRMQVVNLKKLTGDALEIKSVTSDNPLVVTKLATVTAGREFNVDVRYTGEPLTAPLSAKIKITTNDPKQELIEVQVWGRTDPTIPVAGRTMPNVPGLGMTPR